MSYKMVLPSLYDDYYFDSIDERKSLFYETKRCNYYKMSYLSHNTYTFLLNNQDLMKKTYKQNKNILSFVINSREHTL